MRGGPKVLWCTENEPSQLDHQAENLGAVAVPVVSQVLNS